MQASQLSPVFAATVFRPKQTARPPEEQRAGQASYARAAEPAPRPAKPDGEEMQASLGSDRAPKRLDLKA